MIGTVPIGATVAWAKSTTGVPALTAEFVECNGQTLNDTRSPYHNVVLPNLNGATVGGVTPPKRFLRGSSVSPTESGRTGGAETHTHTRSTANPDGTTICCGAFCPTYRWDYQSNLPQYVEMVFVMRIK